MKVQSSKLKVQSCGVIILLLVFLASVCFAEIRKPAVSGTFYPADPSALSNLIKKNLDKVPAKKVEGEIMGIIVPHAGYEFSAGVAAYAYKELIGREYDAIIIMGPSHHVYFDGISVSDYDQMQTPLGNLDMDRSLSKKISEYNPKKLFFNKSADDVEHSIEVQLPLLQRVQPNAKIVSMIFSDQSIENCLIAAQAILSATSGKKVLLIASSDFSHYYTYQKAVGMDAIALADIEKGDIQSFVNDVSLGKCELCGYGPVITLMLIANELGVNDIEILNYANSGDVTGNKTNVVGYAAVAFRFIDRKLAKKDKDELLKISRDTLTSVVSGATAEVPETSSEILKDKRGVFVTLTSSGELRGCIGYIKPVKPLVDSVVDMTYAAAKEDMRFNPVSPDELKNIRIEISVLSKLTPVQEDVENHIVIGKHGLFIVKGGRSGLLLPQVAKDNGWTVYQFLYNVCLKAGLPVDAWRDKDTKLYTFTADVFGEK